MSKKHDGVVLHGDLSGPGDHPCVHITEQGPKLGILTRSTEPGQQLYRLENVREGVSVLHRVGPANVSTDAYREGWDRIFGGKSEVGQA